MGTTYDGNRTATQPPAVAPAPDGHPLIVLPADGDPPNASTYAQPFKELADWGAWLAKPQAKSTDWPSKIIGWRAANGNLRALIDHQGFVGGDVQEKITSWLAAFSQIGTASGVISVYPSWGYNVLGTASHVIADPTTFLMSGARAGQRMIELQPDTVLNNYAQINAPTLGGFTPTTVEVFETWIGISDASSNGITWEFGLTNSFAGGDPRASEFAVFVKDPTLANWHVQVSNGSPGSFIDTGFAVTGGVVDHLRIEVMGASAADDATAQVIFYVNGGVAANITSPAYTPMGRVYCGGRRTTGGGSLHTAAVGMIRQYANIP